MSSELYVLPGEWSSSDGRLRRQLEDKIGVHRGNHSEVAIAESTKALLYPTNASDKAPDQRKAQSLPWTPPESAQFLQILLFKPAPEPNDLQPVPHESTQVFQLSYQPNCGRNH